MGNKTPDLFDQLHRSRQRFGMARIEMGAMLEQARRTEAWRGRAENFGALLEDLCLNEKAAYQYMRVARRFFFELRLPDDVLHVLATANMSTLDAAARVATEGNIAEIVTVVCTLHERDAKAVLDEMLTGADNEVSGTPKRVREPKVAKLVRLYRELPDDQRIDLRNALRVMP